MTTPTAPKYRTTTQACSCPGFWYRRTCKHVIAYRDAVALVAAQDAVNLAWQTPMGDSLSPIGGAGQTPIPANLTPMGGAGRIKVDDLDDAVYEIKRLRELLLDLGVDPDG